MPMLRQLFQLSSYLSLQVLNWISPSVISVVWWEWQYSLCLGAHSWKHFYPHVGMCKGAEVEGTSCWARTVSAFKLCVEWITGQYLPMQSACSIQHCWYQGGNFEALIFDMLRGSSNWGSEWSVRDIWHFFSMKSEHLWYSCLVLLTRFVYNALSVLSVQNKHAAWIRRALWGRDYVSQAIWNAQVPDFVLILTGLWILSEHQHEVMGKIPRREKVAYYKKVIKIHVTFCLPCKALFNFCHKKHAVLFGNNSKVWVTQSRLSKTVLLPFKYKHLKSEIQLLVSTWQHYRSWKVNKTKSGWGHR